VQFKKLQLAERLTSHRLLIQFGLYLSNLHFGYRGNVEIKDAIPILDALARKTGLDVVQLLLEHESDGLSSGEVARKLKLPRKTMSSHGKTQPSGSGTNGTAKSLHNLSCRSGASDKGLSALLQNFGEK
jgi:DNA-binding transcriptional ArsR family regulator